jgi:ERF superfamily
MEQPMLIPPAAAPAVTDLELEAKLAQKILNMEADCGYVQKDKKNPQFNYTYASAEAILKKVSAAAVEHGIASYPRYEVLSDEVVEVGSKGTKLRLMVAKCILRLVDSETGYGRDAEGLGSGSDTLDKAPMKAQTASHKYAWMGLLNISTGDDAEADSLAIVGRGRTVEPEDESQEPPNSAADMEQTFPPSNAEKSAKVLVAFKDLGADQKALEDFVERDLEDWRDSDLDILRRIFKEIKAGRTTWADALKTKTEMMKSHAVQA